MVFLPEAAGPHDAVRTTTARLAGSVRRTTNIDTTHPDGLRAEAHVDGRARDLRTNSDGTTDIVGEARLRATVSPAQVLLSLTTSPDVPALQHLIGTSVRSGFRSRLNDIVPEAGTDECAEGSPLYFLLDDLPGATLVSGYLPLRASLTEAVAPPVASPPAGRPPPDLSAMGDVCAGWARDATMMLHIGRTGSVPVPEGPPAPVLEREGDPFSWHAMGALPPRSIRRRRRLDLIAPVVAGGQHQIDLHFRDSYTDEDGGEGVLHEYTLTGAADAASDRIVSVVARAQVLPWLECPGAVASAERIAGLPLSRLRPTVRHDFVGRSTCTHLNDTLRSLADITALARELEPASP